MILFAKTYFGIVFVSQNIPMTYKKYEKTMLALKVVFSRPGICNMMS
jgi:hypothetical protein